MNDTIDTIAVLILAAGASRRLGRPKALLSPGNGLTLVQRVVNTALGFAAMQVYVVVRDLDDAVCAALEGAPVRLVPNPHWQEGMASSIRAGVTQIKKAGRFDAVLILLVDQPELTVDILESMKAGFSSGQRVVACQYGDVIGVPALIGAEFFDRLLGLTGDQGARNWLRGMSDQIAVVPFPGGARDIDTIDDLNALN